MLWFSDLDQLRQIVQKSTDLNFGNILAMALQDGKLDLAGICK